MITKPLGEQIFSPIKWQREQKKLKNLRLLNDRAALHVMNREEIIAYRLPLHEAILRKLAKNGFVHSAEYLKQLILFQDAYRYAAGEDSIIWQRPRLIYQQNVLEHLSERLQKAEEAHNAKKTGVEIDIILKLAVEFCFESEHWWWLGYQLLFIALNTCEDYDDDRGKRKALLKYVFGRFLFENAKEREMALEHIKEARKIAADMTWNINLLFPENSTIYAQACILIHKIRMMQAKSIMQKDPKNTLRLCNKARKRALEACFYEGVIESYMLKGNCEMMLFDTENAIKTFKKGLEILDKHENVDLRCENLRNLAVAYLRHGTLSSALITLHKLNDYAQLHNKMLYIAQAHKYLGEFYLKEGTARNATPLLMTAMKIFDQVGEVAETAKTRNLAAISVGIELMPIFSSIIRDSDPKFSEDHKEILSKLICWKDSRECFWEKCQVSQFSVISTHTIENLSIISGAQIDIQLPETEDFFGVEELLGITGLDNYSEHSMSNISGVVSVAGVARSGNTLAQQNPTEDTVTNYTNIQGKDSSLSRFVTYIKEDKSNQNIDNITEVL